MVSVFLFCFRCFQWISNFLGLFLSKQTGFEIEVVFRVETRMWTLIHQSHTSVFLVFVILSHIGWSKTLSNVGNRWDSTWQKQKKNAKTYILFMMIFAFYFCFCQVDPHLLLTSESGFEYPMWLKLTKTKSWSKKKKNFVFWEIFFFSSDLVNFFWIFGVLCQDRQKRQSLLKFENPEY